MTKAKAAPELDPLYSAGNLRRMRAKATKISHGSVVPPAGNVLPAGLQNAGIANGLAQSSVERVDRIADQVYRHLRRAIILGEFAPGSRLRELEVAAALNVSRTPVREAVSRLIGDHLVKTLPTGGVEVTDATAELSEIYYIRESLEGCAGRLAAKRITEEQLLVLEGLLTATRATGHSDYDERARINDQFHMTIAEASGSRRLVEMIGALREFFVNADWLKRYDRESAQEALEDHCQIVAALRARSSDRIERLIRRHLKSAYGKLLSGRADALMVNVPTPPIVGSRRRE
jgi:DNA-binding GntR family transcriptional regulator